MATDLSALTVPQLKAYAKEHGYYGYYGMTRPKLLELLSKKREPTLADLADEHYEKKRQSNTDLSGPAPVATDDVDMLPADHLDPAVVEARWAFVRQPAVGWPEGLRQTLTRAEQRAVADKIIAEQTGSAKRDWIDPSPASRAQALGHKSASRAGRAHWTFALSTTLTDAEFTAKMKELKLPKQAKDITTFVRGEGRVEFTRLVERARHFLATKQEPLRILQYYRSTLIQAGVIKITYDDPSVPVVDAEQLAKQKAAR